MKDSIYKYDFFAKEIPRFHLEGHKTIGSSIGCCLSVLLVTIVAAYSGIRGRVIWLGERPTISSYIAVDDRSGSELVDLSKRDFKVAFAVQGWENDGYEPHDDPDFVEWQAYYEVFDQEVFTHIAIGFHKCSDEDYAEFQKIGDDYKSQLELKKKKKMFYCLDKTDQFGDPYNMTIFGNWNSGFGRLITLEYRPCIPRQKTDFNKNEPCLIDDIKNQTLLDSMLQRSKNYIFNSQMELLVNYDEFQHEKYGKDRIKKKSKQILRQFSEKEPTWTNARTSINFIEDQSSFMNIGQSETEKYMQIDMGPNEISLFRNYPSDYKFMSVSFELNMDVYHTDRTSYDIINMMVDVSGVLKVLTVVFGLVASPFALLKIDAMVTSRLFHLSVENIQAIFGEDKLSAD